MSTISWILHGCGGTAPKGTCSSSTAWASDSFDGKWKYSAPLVTSARSRTMAMVVDV